MDAYELHDARFIQERNKTSGAGDVTAEISVAVPAGKVWTILSAAYYPSAAETKTVYFAIHTPAAYYYPVTSPLSIALSPTLIYPMLTEGMELKLYPGEKLIAFRDTATAGSTMSLTIRYIETDLPYYSYEEPLNKVVKTSQLHGSAYRSGGGISPGSTRQGQGGHGLPGGGGGGSQPV